MNDEQKSQWLLDVAEIGDRAFTRWEFCYLEDMKNGKSWMPMKSNLQVDRNREFRRVPNVKLTSGALAAPETER